MQVEEEDATATDGTKAVRLDKDGEDWSGLRPDEEEMTELTEESVSAVYGAGAGKLTLGALMEGLVGNKTPTPPHTSGNCGSTF